MANGSAEDYTAAIIEVIDGIWDWNQEAKGSNRPGLMEKRASQSAVRDRFQSDPDFRHQFVRERDSKTRSGQKAILKELGAQ
jgi:hypothetical protein